MIHSTHTVATLEVEPATYDEIRQKLEDAGYQHAFLDDGGVIDMHGIGLVRAATSPGRAPDSPSPEPSPVDQTTFGAPEGNCLMACVATLTGVPLGALDDLFAAECQHEGAHWWELFTAALHTHGWHPVYLPGADGVVPTGYAIGSGVSPRGLRHAVVVKDGQLAHDPHPSREGAEVDGFYVLVPIRAALSPTGSGPEARGGGHG